MADEIKDQAAFEATLTPEAKAYLGKLLTERDTAAVTRYKTETEEARKKAIPEKYEFKLADGTPLDPKEDVEKIAAYARERGLSNEEAQKFADFLHDRATALTAREKARAEAQSAKWRQEVEADKELGGDNLETTAKNIKRVMDRFAPKDSPFAKFIEERNYGNHPQFVRFLNEAGKAMAEDKGPFGGGGAGKKDLAHALYPNLP